MDKILAIIIGSIISVAGFFGVKPEQKNENITVRAVELSPTETPLPTETPTPEPTITPVPTIRIIPTVILPTATPNPTPTKKETPAPTPEVKNWCYKDGKAQFLPISECPKPI